MTGIDWIGALVFTIVIMVVWIWNSKPDPLRLWIDSLVKSTFDGKAVEKNRDNKSLEPEGREEFVRENAAVLIKNRDERIDRMKKTIRRLENSRRGLRKHIKSLRKIKGGR